VRWQSRPARPSRWSLDNNTRTGGKKIRHPGGGRGTLNKCLDQRRNFSSRSPDLGVTKSGLARSLTRGIFLLVRSETHARPGYEKEVGTTFLRRTVVPRQYLSSKWYCASVWGRVVKFGCRKPVREVLREQTHWLIIVRSESGQLMSVFSGRGNQEDVLGSSLGIGSGIGCARQLALRIEENQAGYGAR